MKEWIESLDRDTLQSVSILLWHLLYGKLHHPARKWLQHLGFQIFDHKKGTYCDGHERADVVEYRAKFLRKMVGLGFLHRNNTVTPEAAQCLPSDIEPLSQDIVEKTSTFQANDDQKSFWGKKDMQVLRPKSRDSGIIVTDFIEEHGGYLKLSEDDKEAGKTKPAIKRQARVFLEYGVNKEGYWNSDKFMSQIRDAAIIAETK